MCVAIDVRGDMLPHVSQSTLILDHVISSENWAIGHLQALNLLSGYTGRWMAYRLLHGNNVPSRKKSPAAGPITLLGRADEVIE